VDQLASHPQPPAAGGGVFRRAIPGERIHDSAAVVLHLACEAVGIGPGPQAPGAAPVDDGVREDLVRGDDEVHDAVRLDARGLGTAFSADSYRVHSCAISGESSGQTGSPTRRTWLIPAASWSVTNSWNARRRVPVWGCHSLVSTRVIPGLSAPSVRRSAASSE